MKFKYMSEIVGLSLALIMGLVFVWSVIGAFNSFNENEYISFRCQENNAYNYTECSCYTSSLDYHAVAYCSSWMELKNDRTKKTFLK